MSSSLLRRLAPFIAALAVLGATAQSAAAHVVVGGKVVCYVNADNVPAIGATLFYDRFESSGIKIVQTVSAETRSKSDTLESSTGSFKHTVWLNTTPGRHHVTQRASWEGGSGSWSGDVTCPAPKPPLPVPTPVPVPPRVVPPPAAPVVPPAPPAPPRFKTITKHVVASVKVVNHDPNVRPPALAARARNTPGFRIKVSWFPRKPSGVVHSATWVHLRLHGPHHWRHLRWYVDGRRIHGTRFSTVRGRSAVLALFDLPEWGGTWAKLWGTHVVTVRGERRERVRA